MGDKKMNRLFFWPFIIAVGLVSCKSNHDVVRVSSLRPKYPDRQIELIKRYVIDVTKINMFSKETSRGFDNAIAFDGNVTANQIWTSAPGFPILIQGSVTRGD